LDELIELIGSLVASAGLSLWRTPAQFRGLRKAQLDRIERLQHRIVQFPSDTAAIVKQSA
jgi:hypothetical protein